LRKLFVAGYAAIIFMFGIAAVALVVYAGVELWRAVDVTSPLAIVGRFDLALEAIAMLTVALASLALADTVIEEEFKRDPQRIGEPARVRRVLGRFLVVVVVSLAIESLVAVFHFVHEDPSKLIHASAIAVAVAAILAGWGIFIRMNRDSG
jgi:hypothetical protein